MSHTPRLVGVSRIVMEGPGGPRPYDGPSPYRECVQRWKAQMRAFRGQPWSACPSALVADHVRSMAGEFRAGYGERAADKGIEFLGGTMARLPERRLTLTAGYTGTSASCTLAFERHSENPVDEEAGVSFELAMPVGASEAAVRQALLDAADAPSEPASFDPVVSLPDEDVHALMRSVEEGFGEHADELDQLMLAAGFLLHWSRLEQINAGEAQTVLRGLTNGSQETCPNEAVSVLARRTEKNAPIRSPSSPQEEELVSVSLAPSDAAPGRSRRSRPH